MVSLIGSAYNEMTGNKKNRAKRNNPVVVMIIAALVSARRMVKNAFADDDFAAMTACNVFFGKVLSSSWLAVVGTTVLLTGTIEHRGE